ncbi:MAG: hypothetical protein WC955_03035 [Elusimicrobiota bacterium]
MKKKSECLKVLLDLTGYCYGDLESGAVESVKAHLEKCGSCKSEYEKMKLVTNIKLEIPRQIEAKPEAFWTQQIIDIYNKTTASQIDNAKMLPQWLIPKVIIGIAAVVAVVIVGQWLYVKPSINEHAIVSIIEFYETTDITIANESVVNSNILENM